MKTISLIATALLCANLATATPADTILETSGVRGGLVVHVECGDGKLTTSLRSNDSYLVQGLTTNAEDLAAARTQIQSESLYGPVSATSWNGEHLPYTDGIVNLIVDEKGTLDLAEAKRVLAPRGVLVTREGDSWKSSFVQPVPDTIDDWTHYLHGPSNSNVARDSVVGSPRRIKWAAGPEMLRHHDHLNSLNAIVSSQGRLVYIFDEGPSASIMLPPEWKLIARDAFSGVLLWKKEISDWHPHLWPLKSMPATLPRRLVAVDDEIFVTLGIEAPISQLDAADGSEIKQFAGSERCEEIIVTGDLVLALCLAGEGPLDDTTAEDESVRVLDRRATKFSYGRRLGTQVKSPLWLDAERALVVFDRSTGKQLYRHETHCAPLTLATDGTKIFFHDTEKLVALDARTGEESWTSEAAPIWKEHHSWFGASLVVHEDVILYAGGENMTWYQEGTPKGATDTMSAYSIANGKKLWSAAHPPSGYRSPEDLMVVQGLVWSPETTHKGSSVLQGRDPKSGEVVREFPVDYEHGFHHRCYPAKATENFLLVSKVGINLVDLQDHSVDNNQWVRGSCGVGFLPANGFLYTTPDPCNCYPESKLNGFAALATSIRTIPENAPGKEALTQGPAYGSLASISKEWPASAWPAYRANAARSGITTTPVPTNPAEAWAVDIGENITAPVVAGGAVYLADIEAHRVESRDADTGKLRWDFIAGGRVDSPPALVPCGDDALCVFGSADGSVTALRASDGALAWRRSLAPLDEHIVSENGLESVWPVHGAVLFHNGLLHAVAGRSAFVDGGLYFYSLDPLTGEVVKKTNRGPADQEIKGMNTQVASTDILAGEDDHFFMRSMSLDDSFQPAEFHKGGHIFASNGFLNDSWFHRSFWVFGTSFSGGAGGFGKTGNANLSGRVMVSDRENLYAFGRSQYGWGSVFEYKLYSASFETATADEPKFDPGKESKKRRRTGKVDKRKPQTTWSVDSPVLVRAMVKARDHLVVAGPPQLYDELATIAVFETPEAQAQILAQGEANDLAAELHFVSPEDGSFLSKVDLGYQIVWDGIAVADNALFISGTDGKLRRYH